MNGIEVGNLENAHHEEMAENFINIIADALAEYDNNRLSSINYYKKLAWGALMDTDAFSSALASGQMTQSDQEEILMINNQEDFNGTEAKGNPCQ